MDPLPILKHSTFHTPSPRGLSIVELIVVLAIIIILTSVAITGQSAFDRSLLLTDTAYTVAFSIREAQTLGLSSRAFGGIQNTGYGIRFDVASPTSYIEYADTTPGEPGSTQSGDCPGHTITDAGSPDARPGNCQYDAEAGELVRRYVLNRGYHIGKVCGSTGSVTKCSGTDFDLLDITFMRPSTNAVTLGRTSSNNLIPFSSVLIYVQSPNNVAERCVTVTSVGQVSVNICP